MEKGRAQAEEWVEAVAEDKAEAEEEWVGIVPEQDQLVNASVQTVVLLSRIRLESPAFC